MRKMYISVNCLEFFQKGNFTIHNNKKDCPKGTKIIKVRKPCYIEVKFGYHESIGVFAPKIRKIKERDISTYKWQASFCNAPDDFTSEYDEDDNGYRFITHDNLGLPFLCRTMHITKDCLVQTT